MCWKYLRLFWDWEVVWEQSDGVVEYSGEVEDQFEGGYLGGGGT